MSRARGLRAPSRQLWIVLGFRPSCSAAASSPNLARYTVNGSDSMRAYNTFRVSLSTQSVRDALKGSHHNGRMDHKQESARRLRKARIDAGFATIEALAEATEDQNAPVGRVIPFPLRFKVGYMRPVSLGLRLAWGGRVLDLGLPNPHAFGHFGFGGSGAWADPERQLGVGVVTNCFGARIPGDLRPVAVATATAHCADHRPG